MTLASRLGTTPRSFSFRHPPPCTTVSLLRQRPRRGRPRLSFCGGDARRDGGRLPQPTRLMAPPWPVTSASLTWCTRLTRTRHARLRLSPCVAADRFLVASLTSPCFDLSFFPPHHPCSITKTTTTATTGASLARDSVGHPDPAGVEGARTGQGGSGAAFRRSGERECGRSCGPRGGASPGRYPHSAILSGSQEATPWNARP